MKSTIKILYVLILVFLCVPLLTFNSGTATNQRTLQNSNNTVSAKQTDFSSLTKSVQTQPTLKSATGTGSWQQLGPMPLTNPNSIARWGTGPFSGRVTAIAVNGSNPNEIFVGAAQGGVWRSTNDGSTWVPLMDQQSSLAVGAIALSPDNSTLYVGTGEPNHNIDGYVGSGLLKSTDGGNTWTTLGASYFSNSAISSILINKTNPNDILVSTTWANTAKGLLIKISNSNGLGVFLSTDGGSSWTNTLSSTNGIADMVANPSDSNIVFAGDFQGNIYASTDGGSTWGSTTYFTGPVSGRVALGVTPANPSYLYFVFVNNTSGEINETGVIDTSASAYSLFNSLPVPNSNQYGPCTGQCWYNLFIAVDPTNINTIYLGTNNLYKSIDGGTTWSFLGGAQINGYLHPDQHALAFAPGNPSTLYSGNDGGIFKSTDGGSSWTSLNTNLGTLQFDSISASPTNDAHLIGGVQDNACDIYSNSTSWALAASGDGGASAFLNNTGMLCNYVNMDPRISINNGLSFQDFKNGLNQSDPSQFYAPMVQDPNSPTTLYFGSDRIYTTTGPDNLWRDLSGIISNGRITSITVSKTNSNILYEGDTQGIVKVSTNGGVSWNAVFSTASYFGVVTPITSVAVDPFNPSNVLVAVAGQLGQRLVVSSNQGSTWNNALMTGLPTSDAINVIKINPVTDTIFLGTDQGLYYLQVVGTSSSWTQLGSGLPNAAIYDFTFTASNYLVVGTHGRGAWLNYMTPFVTLNTLSNNSYYQSGTQAGITINDPNGWAAVYHWDSGSSTTTITNFNINLPSGNGQHVLYVSAQDIAGNWENVSYVFNVDNTSPTISLPSILATTITSGTSFNILISDNSPIQSIKYNWNNTSNTTAILSSGEISVSVPTGNGKSTLYVYAEDAAGNWATQNFVFTIQPKPTSTSSSSASTSATSTSSTSPSSKSSTSKSGKTPGFEIGVLLLAVGFVLLIRKRRIKQS